MNNGFKAINQSKWNRIFQQGDKAEIIRVTTGYRYNTVRLFRSTDNGLVVSGNTSIPMLSKQEIFGIYYQGYFYFKGVLPNLRYSLWEKGRQPVCARVSPAWLQARGWEVEFINDLIANNPERNWNELL